MKTIQCNCGRPILVSDEDFDNLKSYNWTCSNAARAYDKYAREMHGEFAHLNFP